MVLSISQLSVSQHLRKVVSVRNDLKVSHAEIGITRKQAHEWRKAAQERGEVARKEDGRPKSVPDGNTYVATHAEIGIARKAKKPFTREGLSSTRAETPISFPPGRRCQRPTLRSASPSS